MKLFFTLCLISTVFFIFVFINNAFSHPKPPKHIAVAIKEAFGIKYAREAFHVAWCESRFHLKAQNGQYKGLFQMGYLERKIYGHGPTAKKQANAASRYFRASGKDWSPWDSVCRP